MAKLPHSAATPSRVAYPDDEHPAAPRTSRTPQRTRAPREIASAPVVRQVAHELRTPLTAMMGFAQMLLDPKGARPLTEQQRTYVDHILAAGHHLLDIINDLLEVAALDAGQVPLRSEPLDLHALLSEVRDHLAPLATAKAQHVRLTIGDALPTLHADAQRLRQVFVNLLGNAIKFAPAGSTITLGARLHPAHLVEGYVQNTGPVIPRTYRHAIFMPFTQVPGISAPDDAAKGAGLGLAIARQLVRLHGGTIGVRSSTRHGTTFWVRLPRD